MCGICGIFRFNEEPIDASTIEKMNHHMLHRGPDDSGIHIDHPIGLGMRRLSIIDTEGGHQPITNEDKTIWVVMNGEIYNYLELRQDLEKKGHRFYTNSDTEVLVHLYEEKGRDAVNYLNGMFAFALYDKKQRGLWIVRDRLGIKPLAYAVHNGSLYFSSDLKALAKTIHFTAIDEEAFFNYLAFGYIPGSTSIYKGIKKLPRGHEMWIDQHGIKISNYWELKHLQNWQGSTEEAATELTRLFTDAIRLQLRSDVPLGMFLSGGVDSSAVTAIAAQQVSTPLNTFTVDFDGKKSADALFAKEIVAQYGTHHRELSLNAHDASEALDEMMEFFDEPLADSAIISSYLISKLAQQNGIKVMLTGAGGDEIFGGYFHHQPPIVGSTSWIAEKTPAFLSPLLQPLVSLLNRDKALRASDPRVAFGSGYTGTNLAALSYLFNNPLQVKKIQQLYKNEFHELKPNRLATDYTYSRMQIDLRHYLVDDILALTDKTTMACSVEGRVPFLDHRLVEFAFSLPKKINLLNNRPKGLFRHILRDVLPKELLNREKEGFNAPIYLWTSGLLGQKIRKNLTEQDNLLFKHYFDPVLLHKFANQALTDPRLAGISFRLYIFNKWYESQAE